MARAGRFIAVEGLDGSGGTTQVALLAAALRAEGREVLVTGEPTRLPVGRLIRQALRGEEPLSDGVLPYLFAADRRDHLDREILPALAAGTWVISDRYLASSLAYQSMAVEFEHVVALNATFRQPCLTLMLALSPEASLARVAARGQRLERFEVLETLRRVEQGYARALDWCRAQGAAVTEIDASGSVEEVAAAVWGEVAAL
ncbi:MAG: dTMP kinase [Pseudomonadota bacterium]